MFKQRTKEIIAKILYLDSGDEVGDSAPLFTELGLSSIDYIDLCFELQQAFGSHVTADNIWPINSMTLDKRYFENSEWTIEGCSRIKEVLDLSIDATPVSLKELYEHFTVNYLEKRITSCA